MNIKEQLGCIENELKIITDITLDYSSIKSESLKSIAISHLSKAIDNINANFKTLKQQFDLFGENVLEKTLKDLKLKQLQNECQECANSFMLGDVENTSLNPAFQSATMPCDQFIVKKLFANSNMINKQADDIKNEKSGCSKETPAGKVAAVVPRKSRKTRKSKRASDADATTSKE